MMNNAFTIQGDLEIAKEDSLFLSNKRILLLQQVEKTGSIHAASKVLKMSYQQAWHFVKEMNEISLLPLVSRKRGGANGEVQKLHPLP